MARAQFNRVLTKNDVDEIEGALTFYYPQIVGEQGRADPGKYSTKNFEWSGRVDFNEDVKFLTDVDLTNVKEGQLYQSLKVVDQSLRKLTNINPVESNRPTKEQLETLEKEAEERKASQQKTTEEAKTNLETAIKKQQEIFAEEIQKTKAVETALKDKKIYYKVEKAPTIETQETKNLKEQAKADPGKFIGDAVNQYKNNPNLKNLSPDEIKVAAEQAATTTYDILSGNSPAVQIATVNKIISSPEILNKIFPDIDTQAQFKSIIQLFIDQKISQFELAKQFIDVSKIDGITNPESVVIKISETPGEGFKEFDLNQQTVTPYIENLNQQNLLLDNLKGFGEYEIKTQILSSVGTRLENYIATLPANSLLAQTYNSEVVQLGLSSLGIIEVAPWVAVEGSLFGKIVIGSGFGPVAGFIQAKTGINLGVKLATKVGAKAATQVAVSTGTEAATGAATGTGLAAAITAAFAWTGPLAPVIGAVGAFLVGVVGAKVVGKVVSWVKDNAKKYGKFLVGLVGAGFGFILGGGSLLGAILGGVAGYGGAAAVSGGLSGLGTSLSSIAAGTAGFFAAVGGAFLESVGTPILVTFLAFPIVVALILFIINAGAYVVSPSFSGTAGPAGCSTAIADRAGVIANNLELGFDHYYNKSPDYPELWNATLFAKNPNTPEGQIGATDMFWCNYLATKSFLAINETLDFPLPIMVNDFKNKQGKWVDGVAGTYNDVCAGDAVFFYNSLDPAGSISHVGVVAGASSDGITTYESNAPYKPGWSYPTDSSGHFEVIHLKTIGGQNYTISILGFGKP